MKITAGIGSIDEYPDYVEAGASVLFCGYIPAVWTDRFGPYAPLNRREVLCANVQIGSQSELHILKKMVDRYHVPVRIALNALHFAPEQYLTVYEMILDCMDAGFSSFILADPGLLCYLKQQHFPTAPEIIISGETGEINHCFMEWSRSMNASGVIFHRKLTTGALTDCITSDRALHPETPVIYEAFVLNELCHYTGAFCNSLHCDTFVHLCKVPYQVGARRAGAPQLQLPAGPEERCTDVPGATGCGLCALWRLRAAGITHLKLVSRGNYIDTTIRDIRALKQALTILEHSRNEAAYIAAMKAVIFPEGCSRNCYYPEVCKIV